MSRFWSGVFDVLPLMPPPRGEVREMQLPWPLFESSPVALHGLHYRYDWTFRAWGLWSSQVVTHWLARGSWLPAVKQVI